MDVVNYPLPGLIPPGDVLAFSEATLTLNHLSTIEEQGKIIPLLVAQVELTHREWLVTEPLLALYPHYCPYEHMHASFYCGNFREETVEASRKHLHKAERNGTWDKELRPLRNVLSRSRVKIRAALAIDTIDILMTGYTLMKRR